MKQAIFFLVIVLLIGCQEQYDQYKLGDLRISVQVNGINDTSYIVQSYQYDGRQNWSKDWYKISPYDYEYKTLKEAEDKIAQIKFQRLKNSKREIKIIDK